MVRRIWHEASSLSVYTLSAHVCACLLRKVMLTAHLWSFPAQDVAHGPQEPWL